MSKKPDQEEKKEQKQIAKPSATKSFLAGGAGGACLVLVGHPLDTIKVKIQTMEIKAGQEPMYKGTWDCASQVIKRDGPLGLYRGMAAPLTGVTPMYALCFYGYSIRQKLFCNEHSFKDLKLLDIGLAGATSGIFTTPILAPLERLKCVLQTQSPDAGQKFKGPMDLGRHLLQTEGIASVNRGFCATMARDTLGSLFYFTTYEFLKQKLTPKDKSVGPGPLSILFAGGCAGIANWLVALPIDTLKSKLQVAPAGKYPNGIRSVFPELVRNEGYGALYKGFGAVMIRAFPANAACFLGYETAIKMLTWLGMP